MMCHIYVIDRGLFIIDPNGVVRQVTINDLPVGRSVEETLRLVKAFQFVEKHGEGLSQSDLVYTYRQYYFLILLYFDIICAILYLIWATWLSLL